MRAVLILAALALTGCGTPGRLEPKIVTRDVLKPVAAACVPSSLRGEPTYPDTDEALKSAGGAADRYGLLAAGRSLRKQRLAELEPVIRSCRSRP